MKKSGTFLLFLPAAILFCFAGCTVQADFDAQALQEKSEAYTLDMSTGDFTTVADGVASSSKAQLSESALREGWDSTTAKLGSFEGISGTKFTDNGSTALIDISCDFANNGLLIRYTYNAKNEIAGLWLTYVPKAVQPESTDAYEEKAVTVGTQKPLDGILTLPKNTKNPPVVLMIAGSGAQDMNETVGASRNQPFADIAHGLAQQGIASLRYNKRTAQYPTEPTDPLALTIEYEVLDDAAAAADLLKNTGEIDPQRIYVLGHSLGGMLAPKIAQDNGLAGLVCLAGSPRSLLDIMLDQNEAAAAAGQITPQELLQAKALIEKAKNAKQGDTAALLGGTGNYWYSLNQVDTPAIAASLSVPMFFAQGDADFQVSPQKDFAAWEDLFSGKANVQFKLYPGLGHLFTPAPQNAANTIADYDAPQTVDAQVISDIAAWIKVN